MTHHERRSLILLAGLALLGHGVRGALVGPGERPGAVSLLDQASDGDPGAQAALVETAMRPLGRGERVDVDRASVLELRRIPGVGPALAARIVADRETNGAFGSLAGLDRVPGVGDVTLKRLAPMLAFGGRAADAPTTGAAGAQVRLNQATESELMALPGIGPVRARAIAAFRDSAGPFRSVADLHRVPGLTKAVVAGLASLVAIP